MVNRVSVAPDVETARRAYRELAAQEFPEATEPRQGTFVPSIGTIGEESFVVGSCDDGCVDEEPKVHMRIVFRRANVVAVLYTWGQGGNDGATAETAAYLARLVDARLA